MLKNKTKFVAIIMSIIMLLSFCTTVFAENEVTNDEPMAISTEQTTETTVENSAELQEDSYKKSDVYLMEDNVTIDYIVDGNLFVIADTVTINSQIGGDAFIMAKNLIINEDAYIFSNLFTTSETIEVKGVVYDIYAMCNDLTISGGYIYRDVKAFCSNLTVNGTIGRNVFVECASINFNTDELTKGAIYGNLNYTSSSEIAIPENVVSGTVNFSQETNNESSPKPIVSYILDIGAFISFVLIIWALYLLLAPKFLENTNKYVGKKTLTVLGIGALTLIAIPVACIILLILQITSTFSLFLLALYIMALVVSKSLFTITANKFICTKLKIDKNLGIFGMLIISSIVVWGLSLIPMIGWLISLIITVIGLGILVSSILPKKSSKNIKNDEEKAKISE